VHVDFEVIFIGTEVDDFGFGRAEVSDAVDKFSGGRGVF
jgi:hypothetical protein